jgi:hypothetical protein
MVVHTCPPATQEAYVERIEALGKNTDPIQTITKGKGLGAWFEW